MVKKSTYWIGALLMIHALSGSILTFIKSPYGSDLNTSVGELLAGVGLIRSRRATERVEKKLDIDEPSLPWVHRD